MRYGSVCSGIEAATAAWHPLGWEPVFFSEIDKFPSAVLAVHYPDVPNLGDMTKFKDWPDATINVLVGGTPCQSYSVAGLRKGLDDPRGDLMLTYVAIARRYRPSWVVWENVPGVLSDDEGRSFGTLLGLLSGTIVEVPKDGWQSAGFVEGYKGAFGLAWRVLDSQFVRIDGFGRAVPQRRRRVFVVGYLGDWRRAAAVLFERESMSGHPAPRRQSGEGIAPTISARPTGGGGLGTDFDLDGGLLPEVAAAIRACDGPHGNSSGLRGDGSDNLVPMVANPLPARMHKGVNTTMDEGQTMIGEAFAFKASHFTRDKDGAPAPVYPPLSADADKGDQDPLVCAPVAFSGKDYGADAGEVAPTLRSMGHDGSHANGGGQVAVAFQPLFARNGRGAPDTVGSALTGEAGRTGKGDSAQCVAFHESGPGWWNQDEISGTLRAEGENRPSRPSNVVSTAWAVRRLTPTECERLQAFPDGYTNIPWRGKNGAPDGPRYKSLGNSMSVNVMRWIGRRIEMVEEIAK